ncbi:MAG: lipopolysaccharide biosynthesis protein [Eubacteriales bacterium]|nr:lipopolysaccharide biosynthesis protein [Eubacteriales bacterium]
MSTNMKNKVLSGLFWRYGEKMCSQGVSFVISIILARLLTPEDYGVLSLLNIFIAIANTIIISGFGAALVQKKNADDVDFSTIFYFNIGLSFFIYAVLFILAPYISAFYELPQMTGAFRVLALSLIFGGYNTVQNAYVQKSMQFKNFFYSTLIATLLSGVIGIVMAYNGFGIWALIAQHLISRFASVVILQITIKWHPILAFSIERFKGLFNFGWKMFATGVINTVYNNMYSLIIGKFYSAVDLAYYNRGKQWPDLIIANVDGTINAVLLPAYSQVQDDKKMIKAMMRRAITTSTYLIIPAMAGLAAVAKPLTILVLTEKWLPAVPFVQFCCLTFAVWPIHTANLEAIKAVGRSDLFLKLEIIKKTIGILTLVATIPFGLYIMMIGRFISSIISSFLNASPNKKLFDYSYFEQIKDITPAIIASLIMGGVVWAITLTSLSPFVMLAVQVVIGAGLYVALSLLMKIDAFRYLLDTLLEVVKKKRS